MHTMKIIIQALVVSKLVYCNHYWQVQQATKWISYNAYKIWDAK